VSAGWVGASVRARVLLRRRIGPERAADLARSPTLREAILGLTGTAYGRELEPDLDLETAQHEVAAATLLHLRLLSGWLPPGKVGFLRSLAGWYELANVEDRLAYLNGAELRPPFDLGGLASAWPRASQALTPVELRAAVVRSAWGDPGGETPLEIHLGLRAAWAERVLSDLPEIRELVAGALALLLARELFVTGRPVELLSELRLPAMGPDWQEARTLAALAAALPAPAQWALEGIEAPEELWHAEVRWWSRVEGVGRRLVRNSREGRAAVTGSVLLLAVDTWRTAAALAAAEHGGFDLTEVLRGPR
jgi:hypothetical protein